MTLQKGYQGEYDRIYSLGMDCRPRQLLKLLNMGGKRGPFDWHCCRSLSELNQVLKRDINDLFLLENMERFEPNDTHYKKMWDPHSGMLSLHDFKLNGPSIDSEYPKFRSKTDGIVSAFLKDIKSANRVLFFINHEVCQQPDYQYDSVETILDEIPKLQQQLDRLCGHKRSKILFVTFHAFLLECYFPRITIRAKYEFDSTTPWMEGKEFNLWRKLLSGVTLADPTLCTGIKKSTVKEI